MQENSRVAGSISQMVESFPRFPERDALTGMLRGAELESLLLGAILETRPSQPGPAIIYLGLDRFRHLNELLGFEAGDHTIREVAARIAAWLKSERQASVRAVAARMGGDEFAILWPGCPDEATMAAAAERLVERLRQPFEIAGRDIYLTVSAGMAASPKGAVGAVGLLRRASAAMMKAKRRGGNVADLASPEEPLSPEHRYELESALRNAIARGEFMLRFQPQVNREFHLDGLEVLLAWKHPQLGSVQPELFIRLAEEIGAILPIGDWVIEQTCLQIAAWRKVGLAPPRIAVNVSAIQFASPDFVDQVRAILARTGVSGDALEFEITESTILRDVNESAARMDELRALGISLAIDDFGVGYSPLAYLQSLPLDVVKVDRAFTEQITKPSGSLPLVHTITVLAHQRGLKVVAEGVETHGELEMVRAARCDRMQGFLFGLPVAAREVEKLLRDPSSLEKTFAKELAQNVQF